MSRSKKIFLTAVGLFIVLLIYATYDISKRTTFPGSKPQLKERLKQKYDVQNPEDEDTTSRKDQ
jgi:hypothetical protein